MKKLLLISFILTFTLGLFPGCKRQANAQREGTASQSASSSTKALSGDVLAGKWVLQNAKAIQGAEYRGCLAFSSNGAVAQLAGVIGCFKSGDYVLANCPQGDLPFGYRQVPYDKPRGGTWTLKGAELTLVFPGENGGTYTFNIVINGDEMAAESLDGNKLTYHRVKQWPWLDGSLLAPYKARPSVANAAVGKWVEHPDRLYELYNTYIFTEKGEGIYYYHLLKGKTSYDNQGSRELVPDGWSTFGEAPVRFRYTAEGEVVTFIAENGETWTKIVEIDGDVMKLTDTINRQMVQTRVSKLPWE